MSDLVTLSSKDGVGIITINNPPVNALSHGVPEGIVAALRKANADDSVHAIVMIGAGRTFIAGADITQLGTGEDPDLHPKLLVIEDSPKPVVMALHGTALGGGLEVAMAGHYRVAAPGTEVGQPEVNLGLIPGAGGTQRLPRLAGVVKAVDLCVSGAPIGANDALAAGILDEIVAGDLLSGAIAFARRVAAERGGWPKTRDRVSKLGGAAENEPIFAAGREQAQKLRPNQIAPLKAIEAIEAATRLPFEEGSRREQALFRECLESTQAKAMIHAFLGEREVAKLPGLSKNTPVPLVNRCAIVGSGKIAEQIAARFSKAGIPFVSKGTDAAVPHFAGDGFEDVDLILEAGMDVVARLTNRPESFVGLHFVGPANVTRLVEIVRGKAAGLEVIAAALALAKRLKIIGVVVGDCPALVGDRLRSRYFQEAQSLVDEGAAPQQIDRALVDWGMSAGVFHQQNQAGVPRREVSTREIVERCIYALVNEGARILEEGCALRANDVDIVCLTGYGFPVYRGGPMWYADTMGLKQVLSRIEDFERQHGGAWAPAPLLQRLVKEGKTFAGFDADRRAAQA